MKIFLFAILINIQIINLFGQQNELVIHADSLRDLSLKYYNTKPEKCIEVLKSAIEIYCLLENKKWEAYSYQNIAFTFNEILNNIDSSIYYLQKAIPIWEETKDNRNLANNLKYLGMLQGKVTDFNIGKQNLIRAIDLFEKENDRTGVAVSYYNLALLYEVENQLDSCKYYIEMNKTYFSTIRDTNRIFIANNKLLEVYLFEGDFDNALLFSEINLRMENSTKIYFQNLINYYRLNIKLFKLIKNNDMYIINSEKYFELHDKLREQGIIVN